MSRKHKGRKNSNAAGGSVKLRPPPTRSAPPASVMFNAPLGSLAVEVWRLGRRLESAPDANERLLDSHRRLSDELVALSVRIDDPIGRKYIDGLNAEVLDMPLNYDPATGGLVISDVLRPAVFLQEVCIVVPQIMLSREELKDGTE